MIAFLLGCLAGFTGTLVLFTALLWWQSRVNQQYLPPYRGGE